MHLTNSNVPVSSEFSDGAVALRLLSRRSALCNSERPSVLCHNLDRTGGWETTTPKSEFDRSWVTRGLRGKPRATLRTTPPKDRTTRYFLTCDDWPKSATVTRESNLRSEFCGLGGKRTSFTDTIRGNEAEGRRPHKS